MKKEYVKPQNRVVYLSDKLMDGDPVPFSGTPSDDFSKEHFDSDSDGSDSSSDVWED